jgi:LuxR family transcriptional regulator, maltose regulon positive regulatory protein
VAVPTNGAGFLPDSSGAGGTPSEVVKTKLLAPSPRPEQVPRPRLLELLDAGSDRKLTLIGAPAGYGKTTLLTQRRRSVEALLPFAWVSLDEQDNDPVRLWKHVIAALRRVAPEEGFGADVLVGLSVVGTKPIETALTMLINDLIELPHRVALVLDDYHCIKESDCHEAVAFFVEHLPETVHLFISTRSAPPLGLGRLRARGEMNEIRTEQLAFSEEEAASLLKNGLGLNVSPVDLRVLLELTEGWPAAIYLAALSMKGQDTHAVIASLRGSSRYIFDLLAEEVLAAFSEEVREFLLRTSVLEKMSGHLCDEVVGMEGSGKLLRELEHSNLLVVPLDDGGEWYRYHHLFADFLSYELKCTRPKLVPILHRRASTWFEREGLVDEAIRNAIAAGDNARVSTLIARYWFSRYVASGPTATLIRWLDALPEDLVSSDASLALVKAWISALNGQREECERFIVLAEGLSHEGPLPDGTVSVESGVALIRSIFGYGGVQVAVEAARRVAELEPEQISHRTALIRLGMGSSLYFSGDASQARQPLEEGLRLTRVDRPVLRITLLSALSLVAGDEGCLEEAESLAREACMLVDRFKLQGILQASLASIALGRVLAKLGNLAEAQTELESGLSARRRLSGTSPWPTLAGLLALVSVRSARGDRAGAREVLAEARDIMETYPDAGIFPELLESQERKLRTITQRNGHLSEELTQREWAVLRLLDGELSTRRMGESLYVAPSTVRTHIKSIYRKFGVSSRDEAVEEAHARGLI